MESGAATSIRATKTPVLSCGTMEAAMPQSASADTIRSRKPLIGWHQGVAPRWPEDETAENAPMTQADRPLTPLRDLCGPRSLPVLGNLHQIRFDRLHLTLENWAERYGPIYAIRIGPQRIAVISERSAIQRVLVQRPSAFRRTAMLESVAAEMRLKGVFAAEGEDWRRQRRMVVSALNRAKLRDFFPRLAVTVGRLRRRWERAAYRGEPVNLRRDLMRFTVDVTVQLAFGVDANTLETPVPVIQRHLDKVFPVLHRRVNAPFPWWRLVRLPSDRALNRALDALEWEVQAMVRETRRRMAAEPERCAAPTNFLEAILAAVEDGEAGFTDAEIFANAGTLLLAGEDTTANTIAWTVHCFTKHPGYFERARREVDALLAPEPAIGSLEQTAKLAFLDAFCNEVMRLKPVAPLLVFEPVADTELLGCRVPKGTPLMLLTRRMATRDENFADGDRLDPDRWLVAPRSDERAHDRSAFAPFGGGPRLCPGRSLALLQIRTVLAMLCRNFEVEPVHSGNDVDEHLAFTMMPAELSVHLSRR
ncbi:MAG: cytochrome P450 [Rhodospirillaceae bacterium]|nr:cytochrome P450 [Rhodospirillaceae bacterium]MYG52530.1 cytochrome P450 [Rhodospirillaceae bacterium]MYH37018.1 cytochrome P450 [Rhodospirillaceae bacterium]MYK14615.1 cytochrome P450 [Rhodospirillaceae bacterium]